MKGTTKEHNTKSSKYKMGSPLGVHDRNGSELRMGDFIEYVPYGWLCRIEGDERKAFIAYTRRGDNLVIPKDEGKKMDIALITGEEAELLSRVFED